MEQLVINGIEWNGHSVWHQRQPCWRLCLGMVDKAFKFSKHTILCLNSHIKFTLLLTKYEVKIVWLPSPHNALDSWMHAMQMYAIYSGTFKTDEDTFFYNIFDAHNFSTVKKIHSWVIPCVCVLLCLFEITHHPPLLFIKFNSWKLISLKTDVSTRIIPTFHAVCHIIFAQLHPNWVTDIWCECWINHSTYINVLI